MSTEHRVPVMCWVIFNFIRHFDSWSAILCVIRSICWLFLWGEQGQAGVLPSLRLFPPVNCFLSSFLFQSFSSTPRMICDVSLSSLPFCWFIIKEGIQWACVDSQHRPLTETQAMTFSSPVTHSALLCTDFHHKISSSYFPAPFPSSIKSGTFTCRYWKSVWDDAEVEVTGKTWEDGQGGAQSLCEVSWLL